jgi:hypothetical protein
MGFCMCLPSQGALLLVRTVRTFNIQRSTFNIQGLRELNVERWTLNVVRLNGARGVPNTINTYGFSPHPR